MKKTMMFIILAALVVIPGCKRSDVTDPGMTPNAGFRVNLSGIANPGVLLVTLDTTPARSLLTFWAKRNDGTAIAGETIILKITEDIGYFPGDKRTTTVTTDAAGVAQIWYSVDHFAINTIGSSKYVYIEALLQDSGRYIYGYDPVPIYLVTNLPPVDTLNVSSRELTFGVDGGLQTISVFNSSGTDPISYSGVYAPTDGISVSVGTGQTPDTLYIDVEPNTTGLDRTWIITLTASDPDVEGDPIEITVTQAGT